MIPPYARIFVCTEPVDMRRSFDGLALAARERLGHDPRQGGLLAFVNRHVNRLKILGVNRNKYCLLDKRLHHPSLWVPRAPDRIAVRIDGRPLCSSWKAGAPAAARTPLGGTYGGPQL